MNISKNIQEIRMGKRPLFMFFVLAYLFFFLSLLVIGIINNLIHLPAAIMPILVAMASWTPNIAAILIVWKTRRRGGMRELLAGWKKWRVSFVWYLAGICPIVIALVAAGIYSIIQGKPILLQTGISGITIVSMIVFHTIQGATGEELGWRGYALPKLEERYSPLLSAIVLGLLISGWHSVLHLVSPIGVPEWQFWMTLVCYSVIIAWIYHRSNHSLIIVTLFHFSFNFSLDLVTAKLGLIDLGTLFQFYTWAYLVIAVLVTIAGGRQFIGWKGK
jgi:membrane protease YdiL (CAAX protease family)